MSMEDIIAALHHEEPQKDVRSTGGKRVEGVLGEVGYAGLNIRSSHHGYNSATPLEVA